MTGDSLSIVERDNGWSQPFTEKTAQFSALSSKRTQPETQLQELGWMARIILDTDGLRGQGGGLHMSLKPMSVAGPVVRAFDTVYRPRAVELGAFMGELLRSQDQVELRRNLAYKLQWHTSCSLCKSGTQRRRFRRGF